MINLLLALTLQYIVLSFLLLKYPSTVNGDGNLGFVPWIPIVGPASIVVVLALVAVVVAFFGFPVAIKYTVEWVLNKLTKGY